jgi:hypothetical protein
MQEEIFRNVRNERKGSKRREKNGGFSWIG